jgi:glycosyltransferase involved in cell wall biosynthesis
MPLVSCVMPTHNRRHFLQQAIEYFRRQKYPSRELIIVDDGTDPVRNLIPEDVSVRYIRLPRRSSTGAKRNLGCEAARGNFVMLWDDDDWYGDERISHQLGPMLTGRADVTALGNSLVYDTSTQRFWACTSRLHSRMFYQGVVGGTLAFRKRLWGRCRFPDVSEREDAAFLETLISRGARLEKLPNNATFIYVRHTSNTWQFTPGEFLDVADWREVAVPDFLGNADRNFYGVKAGSVAECAGATLER